MPWRSSQRSHDGAGSFVRGSRKRTMKSAAAFVDLRAYDRQAALILGDQGIGHGRHLQRLGVDPEMPVIMRPRDERFGTAIEHERIEFAHKRVAFASGKPGVASARLTRWYG